MQGRWAGADAHLQAATLDDEGSDGALPLVAARLDHGGLRAAAPGRLQVHDLRLQQHRLLQLRQAHALRSRRFHHLSVQRHRLHISPATMLHH